MGKVSSTSGEAGQQELIETGARDFESIVSCSGFAILNLYHRIFNPYVLDNQQLGR